MKNLPPICLVWIAAVGLAAAVESGDLIINEIYYGGGTAHPEAVELLVVKDKLNLNGLLVSDRDFWNIQKEEQCTLQDMGNGFLNAVPAGTLIVIYNDSGTDDTEANDFVLRFYAKSSLFCNIAPTTNAFKLSDDGDNIHLVYHNTQIDFMKYRASDRSRHGVGHPGVLEWENGSEGVIDIRNKGENRCIRFMGDKAEMNDYIATWQVFPDSTLEHDNLGKPNGGRNTEWIEILRKGKGVAIDANFTDKQVK